MSALPYMPLYVADYLADTAHLSAMENGAYLMLIMNYWQRGCHIPGKPEQLARIARVTIEQWNEMEPMLIEFFDVQGGRWYHQRIEHELAKVREKSVKASNAGKVSAKRKASERSTPVEQTFNHTDTDTDTDTEISNHHTRDPDGWNQLEAKCREAAGWQNEPHPNLFVIGPIAALIEAGCILELDVLPTIRARSSACRGVKNWKYFISAIQQARDDRLGALTPANPSKPLEARYGNPAKHNTIANGFAVVDAAIAAERNRIEALERELAGAGVGASVGGESLKLVS